MLPIEKQKPLISDTISRINKIWIAIDLKHRGFWLEWKWSGQEFKSRLLFKFDPGSEWISAKSYDDDIRPYLIDNIARK